MAKTSSLQRCSLLARQLSHRFASTASASSQSTAQTPVASEELRGLRDRLSDGKTLLPDPSYALLKS